MNYHGGVRNGSGRKPKAGRKSVTIYIKEEIIRPWNQVRELNFGSG
jgi:hypothetical protein